MFVIQHALGFTSTNYSYRVSYVHMHNTTLILPTAKKRVSLSLLRHSFLGYDAMNFGRKVPRLHRNLLLLSAWPKMQQVPLNCWYPPTTHHITEDQDLNINCSVNIRTHYYYYWYFVMPFLPLLNKFCGQNHHKYSIHTHLIPFTSVIFW